MDEKYPELPEEISKALNDNFLAIFIGAGASVDLGLPTWGNLSKQLKTDAEKKNKKRIRSKFRE